MSHLHNQHAAPPTDAYGNPIQRTDEYGNPVGPRVDKYGNRRDHHGATTGITPATTGGYGAHDTAAATVGHDYGRKEHHGVTGMLHRSGSSSSSEDDGLGGRRKKGLKQKIKEKLPGSTTTDTTYGTAHTTYPAGHHQEKGMMDKIKDKLPGTGHKDEPHYSTTTHTTSTTTPHGGTTYTEEHHENKGIMDKIKEKLPGGHH